MRRHWVPAVLIGVVLALGIVGAPASGGGSAGPTVVAGFRDGPVSLTNDPSSVASLALPAGKWVVIVKAGVQTGGTGGADCVLYAGSEDVVSQTAGDLRQVMLVGATRLTSPGDVLLVCSRQSSAVVTVSWIKFVAIRVGKLVERLLPDAGSTSYGTGTPLAILGRWTGDTIDLPSTLATVASMPLASGRWWALAKMNDFGGEPDGAPRVECQLQVGTTDAGYGIHRALDELSEGQDAQASSMTVEQTRRLVSSGRARVRCKASSDAYLEHLRILALKAGTLVQGTLGGSYSTSGSGNPLVRSGSKAGPVTIASSESYTTLGSLPLPSGRWAVVAMASVRNATGSGGAPGYLDCQLSAGADFDRVDDLDLTHVAPYRRAPIVHLVVHQFASPGSARLRCRSSQAPLLASDIRIIAIRAGSLTNVYMTP